MALPTPETATARGRDRGLAYELWLPDARPPWPGIVILHGGGSRKENHADFARLARRCGWAGLGFDQRGHGESDGEMTPAMIADAGRMARLLAGVEGVDPERVCARGSSMGGFVAIHAAATEAAIAGAIAICPARERGLAAEVRRGGFDARADAGALLPWLEEHDLRDAVELMGRKPLILLHARGDDVVPADSSEELHRHAAEPSRLIVVPGGHHRSVQHDPELNSLALSWLARNLERGST